MDTILHKENIRVLLIDDHALFADSLSVALRSHDPRFLVTARHDLRGASDFLMSHLVDLIILDLELTDESGLGLLGQLKVICGKNLPSVLLCSAHHRPASIAKAFIQGIDGFISKSQSVEEFYQAARQVLTGKRYCYPAIARQVSKLERSLLMPETKYQFSPRYVEILVLLSEGRTNHEIADELSINLNTLKSYLKDIYSLLGVGSRMACVRKAVSEGIIDFV